MSASRFVIVGLMSSLLVTHNAVSQSKKSVGSTKSVKAKPPVGVKKASLENSRDSLSYSVGYSIAQSMKQQGMTGVNTDLKSVV